MLSKFSQPCKRKSSAVLLTNGYAIIVTVCDQEAVCTHTHTFTQWCTSIYPRFGNSTSQTDSQKDWPIHFCCLPTFSLSRYGTFQHNCQHLPTHLPTHLYHTPKPTHVFPHNCHLTSNHLTVYTPTHTPASMPFNVQMITTILYNKGLWDIWCHYCHCHFLVDGVNV